jgi:predicted outer membrane repeat protein
LTIDASTISGNSAADGGGIAAHGAMTLVDSTVYGNSASHLGGGLYRGTLEGCVNKLKAA